jgi:DNA polymerase III epsilon subunit family exonuclease
MEVAERLLALRTPVDPLVARRLVAAALERPFDTLPDPITVSQLRTGQEAAVADLPVAEASLVVVDLETTGLAVDGSAILEIGAVRISRLEPTERFATLLKPPDGIPGRITALTGIDDRMVADAPSARVGLGRFRRWLARIGDAPFVAHNAGFDAGFVERGLREQGLAPYRPAVLCTSRLARRVLPELGRYNLDAVCAHFGISNPARHRATGDAEVTARALIEMIHQARDQHGVSTLGDLLDLQERAIPRRPRRRKPVGPAQA